jgi:4-hydroxy-tetrahydrodipicolinate reductase
MNSLMVVGASGRSGSLVVAHAHEYDFTVTDAVVSERSPHRGLCAKAADKNFGVTASYKTLSECNSKPSLVIEFSSPEASDATVAYCLAHKIPLLLATTGHTPEVLARYKSAATTIPLLIAANTSRAVFALTELSVLAARLLGPRYDIEIAEIHHRHKKDAPSGTALHVGHAIAAERDLSVAPPRFGPRALRTPQELGIVALRGGDVPGEHTVYFFGESERIEITQRARDRAVFAHGALALGEMLINKPAGLYTVEGLYRESTSLKYSLE